MPAGGCTQRAVLTTISIMSNAGLRVLVKCKSLIVKDGFIVFPQASGSVNNLAVRLRRDPMNFSLIFSSIITLGFCVCTGVGRWEPADRSRGGAEVEAHVNQEQGATFFWAARVARGQGWPPPRSPASPEHP